MTEDGNQKKKSQLACIEKLRARRHPSKSKTYYIYIEALPSNLQKRLDERHQE